MLVLALLTYLATDPPITTDQTWRFDQPVAQGFEDIGLLSVDQLVPMADLRTPDAFDRVYRMTGSHGDLFARRRGGLTAVFPQSNYVATDAGPVAVVPPGTIYVIGEPAPWLLQQLGLDDGLGELTLPTRLDYTLVALEPVSEPDAAAEMTAALDSARKAASPWFSDSVRQRRVHTRLSELGEALETEPTESASDDTP